MGTKSSIEWTDATWNPWQGCTKVSEACRNCYMFPGMRRYGRDPAVVVRSSPATFRLPIKRTRAGDFAIRPGSKVFTCSWSDWFHESADAWRADAWEIVHQRPDLTFQIVTKRPERILEHLPHDWGDEGYPHVWLIVTAENQEEFDRRIPHLLKIPAAIRGVSIEPLLGPIHRGPHCGDCGAHMDIAGRCLCVNKGREGGRLIDWIILGGESGPESRFFDLDHARAIAAECLAAGVACFQKQLGRRPVSGTAKEWPKGTTLREPGDPEGHPTLYEARLKDPKGGDWSEWPADLRLRQFPKVRKEATV